MGEGILGEKMRLDKLLALLGEGTRSEIKAMVRAGRYPPPMPPYEEDEMTQEQFNAMMERYLRAKAQEEGAAWSAAARAWAEETGLITGDESGNRQYRSFVTREQLAVILQRFAAANEAGKL